MVDASFEWTKGNVVIPYQEGYRSDSAVLLHDGRVLYVFTEGASIKGGYAPTVTAFLHRDYSVTDVFTIFDGLVDPLSCAFRMGENIFLQTAWWGRTGEAQTFRNELYVATKWDGSTWALRGQVQAPKYWGNTFFNGEGVESMMGAITVLPSGRWLMPGINVSVFEFMTLTVKHGGVWYSDDAGATWTLGVSQGYYIAGGGYGFFNSRGISLLDGTAYFATAGAPAGGDNNVRHGFATTDGDTWSLPHYTPGFLELMPGWLYIADDTDLFRLEVPASGLVSVWTNPDPSLNTGWTQVIETDLPGTGLHLIMQQLDTRWALMCYGRLINPLVRPPTTFSPQPSRLYFRDRDAGMTKTQQVS